MKNIILKKRNMKTTIWQELVMPIVFGVLTAVFRSNSNVDPSKDMMSGILIGFMMLIIMVTSAYS